MRRPLILSVLLALNAQPLFANEGGVLARMGEFTLTEVEARAIARALPPEARTAAALERHLRLAVLQRALAAEARRQGVDRQPEVAARMRQAADQVLVTAHMNDIARPPADYPPRELLTQAYEANKDQLKTPRQYQVSQIYVAGTDDKARKAADDLAREARRRGANFATIARRASQHEASAAQGGDMGWLPEPELVPAFRQALAQMAKGAVSDPIQGAQGWHVLRLVDVREAAVRPFEEVREALARELRLRRALELEQAHLAALLARTPATVNGIALEDMARRLRDE